jgi:hypothetical protein
VDTGSNLSDLQSVRGLWFAGSSLAAVEPKFAMGNENQSVGAQSQVLCSNTVLEKQPSIKKLPHTVSGLTGKHHLVQRSEIKKPPTPKTKAAKFECLQDSRSSKKRASEPLLNSDSEETNSSGNTDVTINFWSPGYHTYASPCFSILSKNKK